ncbi:MAG TPA: hypothetical protein VK797_10990 [Tepidisphaeraceae bacterium]|nr:hypothetical protein [Tepidisphaeraceae bacterium]
MADEAVTLRDINWREAFPFTHLFRAFRVAVHPSKLVIALVALGCLWCGGLILDVVWRSQVTPDDRAQLWGIEAAPYSNDRVGMPPEYYRALARSPVMESDPGVFHTFFHYEVAQANHVLTFLGGTLAPFESTWNFIAHGPLWLWRTHWLFAILYTAWFLLIWSVLGGAIARIAAVHVARDEKISVRHALTFSAGKVLSFIFAPVIPVLIVLGIGVIIALASAILFHIPWVGPIVAGIFFFLALIGGFVITLVILGTLGGFNLMYPTVAVEGSDSFDAISRSFSYVFARPWRMLWYTIVAVVYGAICYLFVRFFVWLILAATWFFMSWFLGGTHLPPDDKSPADVFPRIWPQPQDPLERLSYSPQYDMLKGTEATAAGLIVWWNYLLIGLVGAFVISFYFSANTIIYYLMRREVDATDLDDVYVEETEDEPGDGEPPSAAIEASVTTTVVTTADPAPQPPPPEPNMP